MLGTPNDSSEPIDCCVDPSDDGSVDSLGFQLNHSDPVNEPAGPTCSVNTSNATNDFHLLFSSSATLCTPHLITNLGHALTAPDGLTWRLSVSNDGTLCLIINSGAISHMLNDKPLL